MCLSESNVQAYIDLELATEAMVSTRTHIDACSKCKLVVNEAITEQQMVNSALAHEIELPVPTVRLRERIDSAINAGLRLTTH
jgi:anti-sigma factor RsiW